MGWLGLAGLDDRYVCIVRQLMWLARIQRIQLASVYVNSTFDEICHRPRAGSGLLVWIDSN